MYQALARYSLPSLVLTQSLFLLLPGCFLARDNVQNAVIIVAERNLYMQSQYGFGEGLAKGVPAQPLLINNRLYAAGEDLASGIGLTVRKVAETASMFESMENLLLVVWTRELLAMCHVERSWKKLREFLLTNDLQLILEPYCVLDGTPDAALLLRIRLVLKDSEKNIWSGQLEETIWRLPLEGEGSWSENNAQRLAAMAKDTLPVILAKVPAYVEEKNNAPEVFYRP